MKLEQNKPSFGVLDGVKVVYAAVELAAPKACCIMAEWGADVTWLENTGAGDTIRDTAWIKQAERRNQRSVALNYFSEEGKEVLLDLIADADIFVESSKGGTWARKGLTDQVLRSRNPGLVIVHVSGYGQTGEPDMVTRAAYDLTVMAYSGYMSQNGTPDQPMNPGPYAGDYFNTLMIVSASLAALWKSRQTGAGETVDLAMYETLLAIGQYYLVDYLNAGVVWPRPGARNQNLCAIGEYRCADGFIGLTVYGVAQNKYLLETIGLGELWGTGDYPEDCSALWLASPKAALIEQKLEEYLATRKAADVERDFSAHRIAAQRVMEFPDLVAEPHLKARGVWQEWATAEGTPFKGLGVFPRFEGHPGRIWRPMPPQGYDSAAALARAGYTAAQIEALTAAGIIKQAPPAEQGPGQ
ncbi:MAG: L-carnitine CoA-transferase [Bifidobacteriaceae bacterium]|jgi:L-carnitine CoA-transferase|nr:L-carnitine CoA-transferase [Bifidobacteriaceae bacterium]